MYVKCWQLYYECENPKIKEKVFDWLNHLFTKNVNTT